jgi:copper resistance protein D
MLSFRNFANRDLRSEISDCLRRFSGLGHVAVAAVVATGMTNTALVLGSWPTDISSPYQFLLDIKVGFVAVMIGLAIVNRYLLVPQIRYSSNAMLGLRFATLAEFALGGCVVALVSLFGTFPPE